MKKKLYLIIIVCLALTTIASIGRTIIHSNTKPRVDAKRTEKSKEQKKVISKTMQEYLALVEKFTANTTLSFQFDYTLFAGKDLNQIAEHIEGNVCKSDSFYKMVTDNSEMVVDSSLSVSVDHDSKKVMVTWSSLMDRRYTVVMDLKEMADESSEIETVNKEGKIQSGYKRFKISSKENSGYILMDLDSNSGFPKRIEIWRIADGIETFDDTRLVITYRNMNTKPIPASEFSYTKYIDTEPELKVKKEFLTYELLTNL